MKTKPVTIAMLASFLGVVLADSAIAQGAPPGGAIAPGTEFPAAQMSHGGLSLSAPTQVVAPTAPAPEAAPAPEPVRKKRRKHHR